MDFFSLDLLNASILLKPEKPYVCQANSLLYYNGFQETIELMRCCVMYFILTFIKNI